MCTHFYRKSSVFPVIKNSNFQIFPKSSPRPFCGVRKCGLAMGQPNRQLSPPNLDLRHIQDHFEFTFPRIELTRFSGGFSLPIFEPPTKTAGFFTSAGNLLSRFQHGSKTWVRLFSLTQGRVTIPAQGVVIVP